MRLTTSLLAALPLLAGSAPAATPESVRGTYRVRADVRLSGVPLVRSLELRGDVVLRPGAGASRVVARLAARGNACELAGRVDPGRALDLAPGQRCTVVLTDPQAHGRVDATVRSGRGEVEPDGRITLALDLALSGAVRVSTAGLPGLPAEADVPVSGDATVAAEGTRDNSRAAEP